MNHKSFTRKKAFSWGSILLLYLLLAAVFILPRLLRLDQFVTPDENLWLRRSANFYFALGQRDYAKTFQREYPGVTGTWAGTGGFLLAYPEYRGSGAGYYESSGMLNMFLEERGVTSLELLVAGRVFVILFCALAFLCAFAILEKLIGLPGALFVTLFLSLDPFYFGLTRLLHLDAMLASFMFLSLLAFLAYQHTGCWPYLLLSSFAAALSWLTKSPGLFLIPFIGLLAVYQHLPHLKSDGIKQLWPFTRPLLIWGGVAAAIFVLMWPSMWVQPFDSVKAIFDVSVEYATKGHYSQHLFYGRIGNGADFPWWYYPVTFLWRATPLALLGLVLAVIAFIRQWGLFSQPHVRGIALKGLLFSLSFMLFMHIGAKKFDRYMLPAQLWLDLIASLGWLSLGYVLFSSIRKEKWRTALTSVGLSLVVLAQGLPLLHTYPYYLTYYDPCMGGLPKAVQVQTVGWGEGLEQAAIYLNSLPDSYKFDVLSFYGYGSLSYYFQGSVSSISPIQEWDRENAEKLRSADYVVTYISQRQRSITGPLLAMLQNIPPDYVFTIDGVEYVWLYDLAKAPPGELENLRQFDE